MVCLQGRPRLTLLAGRRVCHANVRTYLDVSLILIARAQVSPYGTSFFIDQKIRAYICRVFKCIGHLYLQGLRAQAECFSRLI